MFYIVAMVLVFATGENGSLVSQQGFATKEECEKVLPAAEQQIRDILLVRHNLRTEDVRIEVHCTGNVK